MSTPRARGSFPTTRIATANYSGGHGSKCVFILVAVILCAGCTRKDYRLWADRDAYRLIKTRESNPLWQIPNRSVEPEPTSRLADNHNPDCGPVPPDDPAAQCYMRNPVSSRKPVKYWDRLGPGGSIEQFEWEKNLPYDASGKIKLTKQQSVDLALNNSREFQTQVEQLYLTALSLSENRYEFAMNWFGGSDTLYSSNQDDLGARHGIDTANRLGFNRNLASGGQLAVNLLNSFVWQFGGGASQSHLATGNLLVTLTQPLLRGAFQYVRTESLTQSERSLLYGVRDFASFRRQFYLDIVSQYLSILNQSQSIRIEEENVRNLRLNLAEHEELLTRELVSPIQVDQVFQSYQQGRQSVVNTVQSFETALDQFKFQLGLPSRIEFDLDESILKPFQLNSPELEQLQTEADELEQTMMRYLPPEKAPREFFDRTYAELEKISAKIESLVPEIEAELDQWLKQLKDTEPNESSNEDDRIEHQQQTTLANRIKKFLGELDQEIASTRKQAEEGQQKLDQLLDRNSDAIDESKPDDEKKPADELEINKVSGEEEAWKELQFLVGLRLQNEISTLFVSQTQIRLFLINVIPVDVDEKIAVEIALENRLDLMNARAQVVDSFRQFEIAANNLRSDLDVAASANLRTDPEKFNPFRFDRQSNSYNIGLQFDGPLDRMSERNAYRSAQIAYQQQRRAYMATEDSIINQVRQDIRQLRSNRFSFQISRQSLITAARSVDEAQFSLRTATNSDSSLTLDLLSALQVLRNAKNSLISNWVNYEISRIQLFVDLELLNLNESGVWINEQENTLTAARDKSGYSASDRREFERAFEGDFERSDDAIPDLGINNPPRPPETPLPFEPELQPPLDGKELDQNLSDYFKPAGNIGGRDLGDR